MKKRTLAILLALSLMLSCLPAAAAAQDAPSKKIKVLAIGNSYSVDAMTYLYEIAQAHGAQEIVLGNLYIGGCTVPTHWANARDNKPAYEYYKNDSGTWVTTHNATLLTGLQDEQWDAITIQSSSGDSGSVKGYGTALKELVNYVQQNKTNPDAKLYWHMTWSYQRGFSGFANRYDNDQDFMYRAICATVQDQVMTNPNFAGVIPSGTAIQNARPGALNNDLHRDGGHLNAKGRAVSAYTWYCTLTGDRPQSFNFPVIPDGINLKNGKVLTKGCTLTPEQTQAVNDAVMAAMDDPFGGSPAPYKAKAGDLFFIPGAPLPGELADAYLLGSADAPDGTRVTLSVPSNTESGYSPTYIGRLWKMGEDGKLTDVRGSALFGLHDVIAAAGDGKLTLANPADGSHGELGSCVLDFDNLACGLADRSTECPAELALSDKLTLIDLRDDVRNAKKSAATTLDEVKTLCDEGNAVVDTYAPGGKASVLFVLDHTHRVFRGDVFYFIDPVDKTKECEAIVLYSETLPLGITKVTPPNSSGAAYFAHHFWEMMDVDSAPLKRFAGLWVAYTNKHIFGYHDVITEYDLQDLSVTIASPADSHHSKASCPYSNTAGYTGIGYFDESCGDNEVRKYECASELRLGEDLKIYDLRADVRAGLAEAAADVPTIKTLCDEGKAIVNTYVPFGTSAGGSVAAFIVIDPSPYQTRGEAVQALYERAGKPAVSGTSDFTDVAADSKYAAAVAWAFETGLAAGYGDGSFGVNDNVTTEQLAVLLWKTAGKPAAASGEEACSPWAAAAMGWCRASGVLNGVTGEKADAPAARAQIAQMLANAKK